MRKTQLLLIHLLLSVFILLNFSSWLFSKRQSFRHFMYFHSPRRRTQRSVCASPLGLPIPSRGRRVESRRRRTATGAYGQRAVLPPSLTVVLRQLGLFEEDHGLFAVSHVGEEDLLSGGPPLLLRHRGCGGNTHTARYHFTATLSQRASFRFVPLARQRGSNVAQTRLYLSCLSSITGERGSGKSLELKHLL